MRKLIAHKLVRWVSGWIGTDYFLYVLVEQKNTFIRRSFSAITRKIANRANMHVLPLAKKIDKKSAGMQMIEESWWG
jgi:hypothetical protein